MRRWEDEKKGRRDEEFESLRFDKTGKVVSSEF